MVAWSEETTKCGIFKRRVDASRFLSYNLVVSSILDTVKGKTMFNAIQWGLAMRDAIDAKDTETLASLMARNDPNGVYNYSDYCNEFGETTIQQWEESTIDCAEQTMEEFSDNLTSDEWETFSKLS